MKKAFLIYSETLASRPLRPDANSNATLDNFFLVRRDAGGEPLKVTDITDADGLRHLEPGSRVVGYVDAEQLRVVNLPHTKPHTDVTSAHGALRTARYLDGRNRQLAHSAL